jgi:hypothetical protein
MCVSGIGGVGDWGRGHAMQNGTQDAKGREGSIEIKAYNNICPRGPVEAQLGS